MKREYTIQAIKRIRKRFDLMVDSALISTYKSMLPKQGKGVTVGEKNQRKIIEQMFKERGITIN